MLQITINGDSRQVPAKSTIADLLQTLELDARYVAVERNRELVPRARHSESVLEAGDVIEVVTLVGGG